VENTLAVADREYTALRTATGSSLHVKKSSSSNGSGTIDEAQRGLRPRQSLLQKLGVEKPLSMPPVH
jgi:hypothetical protein